MPAAARYPRALIVLHWLLAILLILALAAGKLNLDGVPNSDPGKAFSLAAHITVGGIILILMIARVIVRRRGPMPPSEGPLAKGAHLLLYLLVFLMLASGITMSLAFGLPGILYFGAGGLPDSFAGIPRSVHGIVATILILLILVHVAAAVVHMVRKDGVMKRMSLRG